MTLKRLKFERESLHKLLAEWECAWKVTVLELCEVSFSRKQVDLLRRTSIVKILPNFTYHHIFAYIVDSM